ncbi:NAD-reducing hydrogenase subunit HoxE [Clostridiaceae bacterium JG1575]|nr:NAD-reducing hydrogenase subunit HoxE [Clostridiaceae bacterium JG1575]
MSKYFDPVSREDDLKALKRYLQPLKGQPGMLMGALHHVQDELGFIPKEAQELIAAELSIPMTEVYGVITFYSRFTEIPKGKKQISVCMGTACYVKGAVKILQEVETITGVKAGTTSEDGRVSVSTTRCLGACGMAPVLTEGTQVHGRLHPKDVIALLDHLKEDPKAMEEAQKHLEKAGESV